MRIKITFFVILACVTLAFVASNYVDKGWRNDKLTKSLNYNTIIERTIESDGNTPHVNLVANNQKDMVMPPPPADSVPGLSGFNDYATNGNSLSQILVSGDTVIVAAVYLDSLEIPNSNAGTSMKIRYNVSLDGGLTWTGANDMSNNQKSRYPDASLLTIAGNRTIATSGRYYQEPLNSTVRTPGVGYDVLLGAGSITVNLLPLGLTTGTDLFSALKSNGKLGCFLQRVSSTSLIVDTLFFTEFDPPAGTYTPLKVVETRELSNTVQAYTIGASSNANQLTAAWSYVNEPTSGGDPFRSVRYSTSTDGGVTWPASQKILGNGFLNGDSLQPYWHVDAIYKKNTTNPYVCFATFDYTTTYVSLADQRRPWKVILWSPAVNSGNPVVVADWTKIGFMADTNNWGKMLRSNGTRLLFGVNEAIFGHPAIGFSADGSVMYCTYSVVQPDTATSVVGQNWNFHDIYLSWSLDGGATWNSNPVNVTNTPNWDEVYPVVAAQNNTNNAAYVTYMSTREPGAQVFTDLSPSAIVYQSFKKVTTPIGIINVSNEIPERFALSQNFPNPFNPSTTIRFSVPKNSNVTLEIFDVTGRLVKTLAKNELATAGINEISFNASSYASGIYFYTLTSGDFSETKKMILVK